MRPRVLVVDDNAATCRSVRNVLEGDGMRVFEAIRAAEALQIARAFQLDVILLDLHLPDADCFELVQDLRKLVGGHVPVLAFTGILTDGSKSRLAGTAFDDVVSKPMEPARLRAILRTYLPDARSNSQSFGSGRTLLVADDDPVQRKMVAYKLGRLGFQVITASDGEEALTLAKQHRPDVIVSDVLMPQLDGFELCAELRADKSFLETPILLLTNSYIEDSDKALAVRAGADAYLIRNSELRELADSLRTLLADGTKHSSAPRPPLLEIHQERAVRLTRQLDKQITQNAALTQRNAMLSAQLAILGGLTAALADHQSIDAAMDTALSSCFDAGGISWGVLAVREDDGWRRRSLGVRDASATSIDAAVDACIRRLCERTDSPSPHPVDVSETLGSIPAGSALMAPIVHANELMGALVLGAPQPFDEHRAAFAGVVAGQTALVLALSRTFRQLEAASNAERERAELLSSTLDAIGEPILVVDSGYKPIRWNKAAVTQYALPVMDYPHAEWPERMGLYHEDQRTLYSWNELPVPRALSGELVDDAEIYVPSAGGDARWLSVTARPVRSPIESRVDAVVAVIRDVTAEKRAHARQIVTDRMASIGVLAAGIAHEINNPLTCVLGEIDMVIEDYQGDNALTERLCGARDAALRVATIVRDVKTLSRGGDEDELTLVDLRRVLDTAQRMTAPETRPIAPVLVDIGDLPLVMANEGRLVQVFINLLVNAAQAITTKSPNHCISIRAGIGRAAGAQVEVVDSGSGMSPEVRARLFTPFFTTKPVGKGTGLGLSICNRIITALHGTIECESNPGAGTTFRIWLPRAAPGDAVKPRLGGRLRILAFDPDPLVRQILAKALRTDNDLLLLPSVDQASTRIALGDRFDVVLCGASRSETGALLDQLQAWPPHQVRNVILLVSQELPAELHRRVSKTGWFSLAKPFDAAGVGAFVRKRAQAALEEPS